MLLNLCPKTALEIQLVRSLAQNVCLLFILTFSIPGFFVQIVEDGEDRLSEEEVESLLQVITEHFGEEVKEEEEEEDA